VKSCDCLRSTSNRLVVEVSVAKPNSCSTFTAPRFAVSVIQPALGWFTVSGPSVLSDQLRSPYCDLWR